MSRLLLWLLSSWLLLLSIIFRGVAGLIVIVADGMVGRFFGRLGKFVLSKKNGVGWLYLFVFSVLTGTK